MSNNNDLEIPVIHLKHPGKAATVQKLRTACETVGFFYLTGHGLQDDGTLKCVLAESQRFFNLPVEQKRQVSDVELSRGYTAMEEETLDPTVQRKSGRGDTKEGFYIGRHVPKDSPKYNPAKLSGPNQWPDMDNCPSFAEPSHFQRIMQTYFDQMSDVALQTIRLLALALDLSEHYFDKDFTEPMAALRLLHYAAVPSDPKSGLFACGAHSDYGMLTLLLTDGNPGLQVLYNGQWRDVPHKPGHFVVNLGDMLERWTNGLFKSTKHRVVSPPGCAERYSIPFFYEPNFDTVVECLPNCCSDFNPPKYPPTTSGRHLLDKYKQTHADFQPSD